MKEKILYWMMGVVMIYGASMLTACSNDDNEDGPDTPGYQGMPLVILDTDMGSSTDDLFSLEMLCRYDEQGRCRLLGVVVDREGEDCAACADVMDTYFGHGDVPIGLVRNGVKEPKVWIDYRDVLPNAKNADGTRMFKHSINDYSTLPDGWQLYRKLLAAQPDKSVSICSIGFLTCLAQLLESKGDTYSPLTGVELVRQKVKCIYVMGGVFGEAVEPDYNFSQAIEFSKKFFELWPEDVDVIFSPAEVGDNIEYKPEQVIADIDWTDVHPIKQVYMKCNCNTGQKMWDPMAVINAVEGDGLFRLSDRGFVTLTETALTIFHPDATGCCRYQFPGDAAWNGKMLDKIREMNKIH